MLLAGIDAGIVAYSDMTSYQTGNRINITLAVSNASPTDAITSAQNTQVIDNLPIGLDNIAAAGPNWSITISNVNGPSQLTANYTGPTVSPNAAFPPITVTGILSGNAVPSFRDTATVSAAGDVNSANDSSSFGVNVVNTTNLSLTAATGTYGGNTTLVARLTSGGNNVPGRPVDIRVGATDLGISTTDTNGFVTLNNVPLGGLHAGTYTGYVRAFFAGDSSYAPSSGSSDLSVTPAPLTITANNASKVYGAALPALTASYTGFVNGDTPASLTRAPSLSTTATAASHVAGSPYAITAAGAADPDYAISYVAGSLAVTPAPLTINASNQTKVYGAALPPLTALYSGFVNGDTSASLATAPTLSTTATAASHVAGNPYAITAAGAADPDYTIGYVPGYLTVTTAPLTITANNQTKVYGAPLPTLTASYMGFVNGDTPASLATAPSISAAATAASHVAGSPYAITAAGAIDSDYAIGYGPGYLTVTPAPLTIAANNQAKVYGGALPALTASYTGFVNGDSPTSLSTAPTLSTAATAASHVAGSPYAITAGGAAASDYAISYVAGSLAVNPAPLTITANDASKLYGAALPTLTASYSGLVNGDTSASLGTAPTLSTTATASSHVSGGPYAVTASGAADPDYTIGYAAGSLAVTPAPLTITPDNQSKVYGAALPALTASYRGFVNGDTSASLGTPPTLSTAATAGSHVSGSPYTITASGAIDPDYAIGYGPGYLTVTPASLTISPNNQTKAYGAALPALTASYAGFVNGDTSASLGTAPTLSTTATSSSHVAGSPYSITAGGAADPDYTIGYAAGSLSVTPVPLTITPNNQTKVYGAALPTLTASYSGLVNGDTSASLGTVPTLSTTATASSHVAGSPYSITAGGAADPDYAIGYAPGNLAVTPAPLQVAANNQTKVYGQPNPALTATVTGVLYGDDVSARVTTAATATSDVVNGGYPILVDGLSGAGAGDYSIANATAGSLTITPAPLTITANDATKVYGQPTPSFTASYGGFVLGQGPGMLSGPLGFNTSATAASHVGNYPVVPAGPTATNYAIRFLAGNLTVTPASLTVTPDNIIIPYGPPIPTLTARYSGLVNGDTPASLTSPVTLATTAANGSPSGVYPITASGGASADYAIQYVPGAIAITPNPGQVAFVTSLYQTLLHRSPDGTGLRAWLTTLAGGRSSLDVARQIYNAPETVQYRAHHKGARVRLEVAYKNALIAQAQAH